MKYNNVGKWLTVSRTASGYTKADIRKMLGINFEGFIENIEAGRRCLPLEKVELVCLVLGVHHNSFIEAYLRDVKEHLLEQIVVVKEAKVVNTDFAGLL